MLGFHPRHSNRSATSVGADAVRLGGGRRYPTGPDPPPTDSSLSASLSESPVPLSPESGGWVAAKGKVRARRAAYRLYPGGNGSVAVNGIKANQYFKE